MMCTFLKLKTQVFICTRFSVQRQHTSCATSFNRIRNAFRWVVSAKSRINHYCSVGFGAVRCVRSENVLLPQGLCKHIHVHIIVTSIITRTVNASACGEYVQSLVDVPLLCRSDVSTSRHWNYTDVRINIFAAGAVHTLVYRLKRTANKIITISSHTCTCTSTFYRAMHNAHYRIRCEQSVSEKRQYCSIRRIYIYFSSYVYS
jgi:hypothetical protein